MILAAAKIYWASIGQMLVEFYMYNLISSSHKPYEMGTTTIAISHTGKGWLLSDYGRSVRQQQSENPHPGSPAPEPVCMTLKCHGKLRTFCQEKKGRK